MYHVPMYLGDIDLLPHNLYLKMLRLAIPHDHKVRTYQKNRKC